MAEIASFLTGISSVEHEILRGYGGYIYNVLNFATTSVASGSTVQLLKVGNGQLITRVSVRLDTPEGGTLTISIGDGTDADGWDVGISLNGTTDAVTRSLEATDAYGAGKVYTAADNIDGVFNGLADGAKITIIAEYVRVGT